jgi:hypothetical protein
MDKEVVMFKRETSAQRAESITSVVAATKDSPAEVQQAAVTGVAPPIGAPTGFAKSAVWIILVSGLVAAVLLAVLSLAHVIGSGVEDDKMLTVLTTALAGLLGLFVSPPHP